MQTVPYFGMMMSQTARQLDFARSERDLLVQQGETADSWQEECRWLAGLLISGVYQEENDNPL